jgi:beta-glucosidase-like glycosyl hydrolase/CubicO group peptidase (beta-lactamase class C family)
MTITAHTEQINDTQPASTPAADEKWVSQTLAKLTLREKIGQLMMVTVVGQFTSADSSEYKELVREVTENHVGGFILITQRGGLGIIRGEVYPTAVILNQLQERAAVPLLIGADFERGTGMRLDEGTSFPFAMAVAAADDPRDAYTVGKVTALESRAAGLQWIFAPDADVNDNPQNPIINTRSFGEDPQRVAAFVTQFIRGVEENGGLATAKHFPGHGDVSTDSHLGLPTVPGDRQRLENVELVPFRAAIAAGASSIMTGHLSVPAFEPDTMVPATLSPNILTGLLRKQMGYQGLVVTDALDMGGVTSAYTPGEAAVRTILAGADVLLMPPYPDAALEGLVAAVESGRVPEARIDDSVRRILQAKSRLGLAAQRTVDVNAINQNFARPEFAAQAADIANRGITLLRDDAHLIPVDVTKAATQPSRVLLVAVSGDPDAWPAGDLEQEIRPRVDHLTVLRADTQYDPVEALHLPPPSSYDLAIAAVFVRVADRKGNVGLPDNQGAVIDQLLAAGKPVIVAGFGSPYLVERFPAAKTWIASFSTPEVSQRAMARAIFGETPIAGKIPVTVPEVAKRGDGLRVAALPMTLQPAPADWNTKLAAAYRILDHAVKEKVFPGGVLAVGWKGSLTVHPFGHLTYDRNSELVTPDTVYDVASLTKPVVTATEVAMLAEESRIHLDAPISRYLPEWMAAAGRDPDRAWRARVTVRQLLQHSSGLPAHHKYYQQARDRREVLQAILTEPLVVEPGTKVEYSDLGFILLGEIITRQTGEPLDRLAHDSIFDPLGMSDSKFNPPAAERQEIAPTEDGNEFRQGLMQGEVNDGNAFAMGGVAGHAGLFSTAPDMAAFAQMMLNGGMYAHERLLRRATVTEFTTPVTIGRTPRALGWDVPTADSSSGEYFSAHAYGHLGYTGTSLWIDPQRDVFVVLLTNRVHPSAANDKIRKVRPEVHDAVMQGLGLGATATR